MLYDPKWKQKTKTDPFSFESLVAWLETQDPNESYSVGDPRTCLVGQWLMGVSELREHELRRKSLALTFPFDPTLPPFVITAFGRPRTFGAALKRARKARENAS